MIWVRVKYIGKNVDTNTDVMGHRDFIRSMSPSVSIMMQQAGSHSLGINAMTLLSNLPCVQKQSLVCYEILHLV